MMKMKYLTALLLTTLIANPPVQGQMFDSEEEGQSALTIKGLLDVRGVRTSKRRSTLYTVGIPGGNKLRYGGKDIDANHSGDRPATQFAIPQASLVVEAAVHPLAKIHAQANFDADFESGNGAAGLVEAYAESELGGEVHSFRLKAGGFVPPLSWEHTEPAWSTRYTLTPSAIGTWAGDDIRVFGAEGTWQWRLVDHRLRLMAGGFSGADQTGWAFVQRGWTLHDFQAPLDYTHNLPSNETYRPFKELDGRLGNYQRAEIGVFGEFLALGGGRWDNKGDIKVQTIGSHLDVFHTDYADWGGRLKWAQFVVIAQQLHGHTESLSFPIRSFDAAFGLIALDTRHFIVAGRYDTFEMEMLEKGNAITGALTWKAGLRQHITIEHVFVEAEPPNVPNPTKTRDRLTSLNLRYRI